MMSDTPKVETSTGEDTQGAVEFGRDGKPTVTSTRIEGLSMAAVDPEAKPEPQPLTATDIEEAVQKEIAAGEAEDTSTDGEKDPEEKVAEAKPEDKTPEGAAEKVEDLGEFKADDPEVVSKFHERYFNEEGKLNEQALSAEFWGNVTAENPGGLHESTYAYLEHQLGVSKQLVKDLEQGLVAKHRAAAEGLTKAVHEAAGGKDAYEAAIQWASAGGYTPEQGNRLNTLIREQKEGWEDAVEALVSRFRKANPQKEAAANVPPGRPQRRSTPERIAGQEHPSTQKPAATKETPTEEPEGGNKPAPFDNADAYLAALSEANKDASGKKMAEVRARLRASPNVRM